MDLPEATCPPGSAAAAAFAGPAVQRASTKTVAAFGPAFATAMVDSAKKDEKKRRAFAKCEEEYAAGAGLLFDAPYSSSSSSASSSVAKPAPPITLGSSTDAQFATAVKVVAEHLERVYPGLKVKAAITDILSGRHKSSSNNRAGAGGGAGAERLKDCVVTLLITVLEHEASAAYAATGGTLLIAAGVPISMPSVLRDWLAKGGAVDAMIQIIKKTAMAVRSKVQPMLEPAVRSLSTIEDRAHAAIKAKVQAWVAGAQQAVAPHIATAASAVAAPLLAARVAFEDTLARAEAAVLGPLAAARAAVQSAVDAEAAARGAAENHVRAPAQQLLASVRAEVAKAKDALAQSRKGLADALKQTHQLKQLSGAVERGTQAVSQTLLGGQSGAANSSSSSSSSVDAVGAAQNGLFDGLEACIAQLDLALNSAAVGCADAAGRAVEAVAAAVNDATEPSQMPAIVRHVQSSVAEAVGEVAAAVSPKGIKEALASSSPGAAAGGSQLAVLPGPVLDALESVFSAVVAAPADFAKGFEKRFKAKTDAAVASTAAHATMGGGSLGFQPSQEPPAAIDVIWRSAEAAASESYSAVKASIAATVAAALDEAVAKCFTGPLLTAVQGEAKAVVEGCTAEVAESFKEIMALVMPETDAAEAGGSSASGEPANSSGVKAEEHMLAAAAAVMLEDKTHDLLLEAVAPILKAAKDTLVFQPRTLRVNQ